MYLIYRLLETEDLLNVIQSIKKDLTKAAELLFRECKSQNLNTPIEIDAFKNWMSGYFDRELGEAEAEEKGDWR